MNKARKTTFQERITIVKDCLENGSNYGGNCNKIQCQLSAGIYVGEEI